MLTEKQSAQFHPAYADSLNLRLALTARILLLAGCAICALILRIFG